VAEDLKDTDESLMERYRQGEFEAFESLYQRHGGKVLGYLRSRLKGDREAEDLFQQVFLKLHGSRDRYDATLPFLPWLFSITRHVLIDHVRKAKPVPVPDFELDKAAPPVEETDSLFREAVSDLSAQERKLLEMRYEQGLSFTEISKRTGLKEPAARKRVSRLIESIRKRFEKGDSR